MLASFGVNSKMVVGFVVLLLLSLSTLVLAYPATLTLTSNLDSFSTTAIKCGDYNCTQYTGPEIRFDSTGQTNQYTVQSSGASAPDFQSYLEFDYADAQMPKILIRDFTTSTASSSAFELSFSKMEGCNAPVESITISNDNPTEGSGITVTAKVLSSMWYTCEHSSDPGCFPVKPKVPADLENIYSSNTTAVLKILDSNNQVVGTPVQKTQEIPADTIGDIVFSNVQMPQDGSYTVKVFTDVEEGWCYTSTEKTGEKSVDVADGSPTANFSFSPASPAESQAITFTDTSSSNVDSFNWSWDFGDGSPVSTDQNPTHSYGVNGSYTVTLTVTDSDGDVSPVQKIVNVGFVNDPPAIQGTIPNQQVNEDGNITLDLTAYETGSDEEDTGPNTGLSWSITGLNASLIDAQMIDAINNILKITTVPHAHGLNIITLKLTDSGGLSDTQDITVTVLSINDPVEKLADLPDISFDEDGFDDSIDMTNYFSDVDDPVLTYGYGSIDGNVLVSFVGSMANISASADWYGAAQITLNATDGEFSAEDTIQVSVNPMPEIINSVTTGSNINPHSVLINSTVTDSNVTNSTIINSSVDNSTIEFSNVTRSTVLDSTVSYSEIEDSYIDPSVIRGSTIKQANVTDSEVDDSNLTAVDLVNANVTDDFVNSGNITYDGETYQGPVGTDFVYDKRPELDLNIPNWSWPEDTNITINLSQYFSDPDGDDLEFTAMWPQNITIVIDNTTGIVTIAPHAHFFGNRTIVFTAWDPKGKWKDSNTVDLNVSSVNDVPELVTIPDLNFDEDSFNASLDLDEYVSDSDHNDSEISWSASATENISISIDPATHVMNVSALPEWAGQETFTLTASDGINSTDSNMVTVTVNGVNDAPEFNASNPLLSDLEWDEDSTNSSIVLTEHFYDVDSSDLNWSYSGSLENISVQINQDTGAVALVPDGNFSGNRTISFTATDGALQSGPSNIVSLRVRPINDAPVLVQDIPDHVWPEDTNHLLDLPFFFEDVDGDNLTYSVILNPDNVSVNISGGIATFYPDQDFNGENAVQFQADDGNGGTVNSNIVTLNITPVNDAPAVSGIPDVEFNEDEYNDSLTLSDYVSDVDNADSDINWIASGQTNVIVEIDNSTKVVNFTAAANWYGSEMIELTGFDPEGLNSSQIINVTVNPVNDNPNITNSPALTADEDSLYIYDVDASDVDTLDILTFSLLDNPANMTINSSSGLIEWAPVNSQVGENNVSVQADDGNGGVDTQNFTITVSNTNDAPVLAAISGQNTVEDVLYEFNVTANDDDLIHGDNLTYSVNDTRFNIAKVSNTLSTVSYTPTNDDALGGSFYIEIKVNDTAGEKDIQIVLINVENVNDAPYLATPVIDVQFDEDSFNDTLDLDNYFDDSDNQTLVYSADPADNLTINISGSSVNITADQDWNGDRNVTFNASDGEFVVQDIILVTVNPINDAPVSSPMTPISFDEDNGTLVNLSAYVTDADNLDSDLNWSITGGGGGSAGFCTFSINYSIDNVAKELTINGNPDACGNGSLGLLATDGLLDAEAQTLNITINPVNDAPVVSGIPGIEFNEDEFDDGLNLSGYVSDVDNFITDLNWTASGQTDVIVNIDTGAIVNFTANANFNGQENITFTAEDLEGKNSSQTIEVTVNSVNDEPAMDSLAITGANASSWFKANLELNGTASDIDSSIATIEYYYSLDSTDGAGGRWTNINNLTIPLSWNSEPQAGADELVWIRARAEDDLGNYSDYLAKNISVDNQVPNTSHNYTGSWMTENFTVALTADDFNGSGVDPNNIWYKVNGEAFDRYVGVDGHPVITAEGNLNYIEYKSTDNIANAETTKNLTGIKLDKADPVIENLAVSHQNLTEDSSGDYVINVTVYDLVSGLASTPTLTYQIGSQVPVTENLSLVSESNYTFTISEPAQAWNFFRSENLTFTIEAVDVAGRASSTSRTDLIENMNDMPVVNITAINGEAPEYKFYPNTLEIKTEASDPGDPAGNSVAAGYIENVTFEYSTDSINGSDGNWSFCAGSSVPSSPPEFIHTCAGILASGEEDDLIWLRVRSLDDVGAWSEHSIQNISIDVKDPATTDNVTLDWYSTGITVELNATDSGSGLNVTKYCLRTTPTPCETPPNEYTAPIPVSTEGISYLYYKSWDNLDNQEVLRNKTIRIDLADPSISLVNVSDDYVQNNTAVLVTVNATDSLSGINIVTADGEGLNPQGSGIYTGLINLTDAKDFVEVVATDLSGRQDLHNSTNYTIDDVPPDVNVTLTGHNNLVIATNSSASSFNTLQMLFWADEHVNWGNTGNPSIEIFNGTGSRAKFFHGSDLINLSLSKSWGFGDNSAEEAQDGLYTINVSVKDRADNQLVKTVGIFTIDNSAPETSFGAPAESIYNSNQTVNITASDAHPQNITILVDGVVQQTCAYPECTIELSDGNHTVYGTANDTVGNENQTEEREILIDTIYPSVEIINISPDPAEFGVESVTITWSASDENLEESYLNVTYPDGILVGQYHSNITMAPADLTKVGTYNASVYARDIAGNINTTMQQFVVDDILPPEISSVSVTPNPSNESQEIKVSANVFDHSNISYVNVSINSVETALTYNESSGLYEIVTTAPTDPVNYTLNVTAEDIYANFAHNDSVTLVVQDTTAPTVSAPEALPFPAELKTDDVVLRVNATDFSNLSSVVAQVNGLGNFTMALESGDRYTTTIGKDNFTEPTLYNVVFVVTDTFGNVNSSTITDIFVDDSLPPEVAGLEFTNLTIEFGEDQIISVNATDLHRVESVEANVTGPSGSLFEMSNISETTYQYTLVNPAVGEYLVQIIAADNQTNKNNSVTGTFNVSDRTSPTIDYVEYPITGYYNTTKLINVTGFDLSDFNITIIVNGSALHICSGSGTLHCNYTLGTDGNYTFYALANDTHGNDNTTSTVENVLIDLTLPTVSIDLVATPTNVSTQEITGSFVDQSLDKIYVKGVEATINGSSYNATLNLVEGNNVIDIVITDFAGNAGSNSTSIFMDTIKPGTSLDLTGNLGENGWYKSDVLANLTCSDSESGCDYTKYRVWNGSWTSWLTGNQFNLTTELDNNTIEYYSIDLAGNIENTQNQTIKIDKTAPEIGLAYNSTIYEGQTAGFNASSSTDATSGISSYLWDFHDGTNSTDAEAAKEYLANGTYQVNLSIEDLAGNVNITSVDVSVNDLGPTAEAGPNQTVDEGEVVYFNASNSSSSPDTIDSYFWDFGDGENTTGAEASHTYNNNGTYTAILTVTDSDGSTDSDSLIVTANDLGPSANFSSDFLTITEGGNVSFADLSHSQPDTIANWSWDFGDGQNSSDQNATHQFTQNDTYTVNLTVTDSDSSQDSYSELITVLDGAPSANFTWNPDIPDEDEVIQFNDTSTSPADSIANWSWDFGDGSNSADQNPTHSYANTSGTFTIELVVTDSDGSQNSISQNITVEPVNDAPFLNASMPDVVFDEDGSNASLDMTDYFDDIDNSSLDYSYSTTDGNVSAEFAGTLVNITATADWNGDVNVTLKASDGEFEANDTILVTVNPVNDAPVIELASPDGGELWNGLRNITWDASDVDEDVLDVDIDYWNGSVWIEIASGETNDGAYEWDTSSVPDSSAYKINTTADDGTVNVSDVSESIFTIDNTGPSVTLNQPEDGANVSGNITVNASVEDNLVGVSMASFRWENATDEGSWTSLDNSTGNWLGTLDTTELADGYYNITTNASDVLGNSNGTVYNTIRVDNTLPEIESFEITGDYNTIFSPNEDGAYEQVGVEMNASEVIENWVSVKFEKTDNESIYKYYYPSEDNTQNQTVVWNGELSSGVLEDGVYNIIVRITDYAENTDTLTIGNVTVDNTAPAVDAGLDQIVDEGSLVNFSGSSSSDSSGMNESTYFWDFGDGKNATGPETNHTYVENGSYTVSLFAEDNVGNNNTDSITITVDDVNPAAVLTGDTEIDEGQTAGFDASGSTAGSAADTIDHYEWDFSYDGISFNIENTTAGPETNHTFMTPGMYTVGVRVVDEDSYSTATTQISVRSTNHELSVNSLTYNKSDSTVYLYDTILLTSHISNNGAFNETFTVKLKDGTTVLDTKSENLSAGESKEITFAWIPDASGFHTLTVEIEPVAGEIETSNNQKSQAIKAWSIQDTIDLEFKYPDKYPKTSESAGSTFYVWVRITSNTGEDLHDLSLTLDTDGLSILSTSNGAAGPTKLYDTFTGSQTFWWKLDSDGASGRNITVHTGNVGDREMLDRFVTIS